MVLIIKQKFLVRIIFFVIFPLIFSCNSKSSKQNITQDTTKTENLTNILSEGKFVAVTDYNSTNYFVYKGEPMGYHYELLKIFAEYIGVKLEVVVSNDLEETFNCLQNGECDIIAMNLTVTKDRAKRFAFTEPHNQTRQVLVQRKPEGWEKLKKHSLENHLIRNQLDIGGKTVFVQKKSIFYDRLITLSDEIGKNINVVELSNYETEQLISLVASGEIDYTVCDEIVGLVNQTYYPNIDVGTTISFPQNLAWAVKKDANDLRTEIDKWLIEFKKTVRFRNIYNKYFRNSRSANIAKSEYNSISGGRISEYDELIKKFSENLNWDWRLLASLIYQESKFKPNVRSWAGAYGLMQLMPSTAERYGVDSLANPEENIEAGVKFLIWLDQVLSEKIDDEKEKIKFILGSYNVGLGHVIDARALAKKNGKDPDVWNESVDYYLIKKSQPKYYHDPVVQHGYCRGIETYNYVTEILERYEHYKNVIVLQKF
ncbi:MAG: transporter substrate-binding domain-containing protein [Bacteroidetes bacterium]|jgi:membrane-bound lytic murein transglycosylase F|nr:transporter substrate-binding domain-containing protein [Bacteroidota bacterium]MBT6685474.1 transporter substrate-binding domain-containing protein [Bacteroidota bacterium]MBT7145029.1 transporter substrate-binding domain-containing protein [Bacteroidota bacterium]MBT7492714.1 transporter substrate-binding domain-containing protein [Bacteroidota bacterium]